MQRRCFLVYTQAIYSCSFKHGSRIYGTVRCSREALARKQFFHELRLPSGEKPVTLLSDSQSALDISENPAKYRQAKHIDIRYHAIRHYIHDGKIEVDYIPSERQPADLFTKALGPTKHQQFCHTICLRNSYEAKIEEVF